MGPWPHCEKQPALLMRPPVCVPAVAAAARRVLTYFSTSPCVGQVSPEVQTKTWHLYCPMVRWSSLELAEETQHVDAHQVVVYREHHQHQQQHEAHLLGDLALPLGQRAPQDGLADEEEQVPTVEHGHGQEVEEREIHAEHRGEEGQAPQAGAGLASGRPARPAW